MHAGWTELNTTLLPASNTLTWLARGEIAASLRRSVNQSRFATQVPTMAHTFLDDDCAGGDAQLGGGLFAFVFQPWLDLQMLTNHSADHFEFKLLSTPATATEASSSDRTLSVEQEAFVHTKTNDRTGAVVWDDAVVLARYLESIGGSLANKRVVELGSGTGFLGMVVASVGADVLVTDRDCMLPLMERNCQHNGGLISSMTDTGRATVLALDWFKPLSAHFDKKPDFIVASGVVYSDTATPQLLHTLRTLGSEGAELILAIDFRFECDYESIRRAAAGDHTAEEEEDEEESGYVLPVVRAFLDALEAEWAVEPVPSALLALDARKGSVAILRGRLRSLTDMVGHVPSVDEAAAE